MKIGLILSGCGVFDGSEIHEATLALLHVVKAGAEPVFLAPAGRTLHVVNHQTGEVEPGQQRDMMAESARLARGEVMDVAAADVEEFSAFIFPGGYGAAKNLSNFALVENTDEILVHPDVKNLMHAAHQAGKPMGFMCITPVALAAPAFRGGEVTLTSGEDVAMAAKIEAMGHIHENCSAGEIVVDIQHNIVSTPAYMCAENIAEVNQGAEKMVAKIMEMIQG